MGPRNEQEARAILFALAREARSRVGLDSNSGWAEIAARAQQAYGVAVKTGRLLGDDGWHIPDDGGVGRPTLVIDPLDRGRERLAFTFCHELMHHLIRQEGRLLSFLHDYAPGTSLDTALDRYCNMGAAEMLMPSGEVRRTIEEQGFSITLIEQLDRRLIASKPAIAIQLAQCASHECYIVECQYGVPGAHNRGQPELAQSRSSRRPCLHTTLATGSPSAKYPIGRYVTIPPTHLMAQAYEEQSLVKGFARIPFRNPSDWRVDCEAFFYRGKVYATFNVTSPNSPQQMRLL